MCESVGNGAMMKLESSSRELLTKHIRDFIVNAMHKDRKRSRCLPDKEVVLMSKRTDKNPGRARVWRYGTWGASLLCSAGLLLGGCVVTKGKYEMAVADMEAARTELEKSRMQYEALQQEKETLQADHEKAAFDLEMLSAEIRQIKEGQKSEQDLLATREADLQRDREAMVSKLQEIQHVYQVVKSQNRALRDAVRRYQKELEEARKAKVASKTMRAKEPVPKVPPVVAKKPSSKPSPLPGAVPFNGTATPVNINKATAEELHSLLGIPKELADKIVANGPYRLRGELVAKQVVDKTTFDAIKDRITAAPQ